MPNLVEMMKKAALDAVDERKPVAIVYGEVISITPLKVQIDQKLTLSATQLILTNNVKDHTVEMTVDHLTENRSGGSGESSFASHNHAYTGKKTFTVHNALKVGDGVAMLRMQGGQKYMVLERGSGA